MVGSASGPGRTFKAFLGSAQVQVTLSNKIQVRVGSVQHIYGSLRVRVRIFGPVNTSNQVSTQPCLRMACETKSQNVLLQPEEALLTFSST